MMKGMKLACTAIALFVGGAGAITSAYAQEPIAPPQSPVPSENIVIAENPLAPFIINDRGGRWGGNGQFWASGDYMFTWMRGVNTIPLVSTSPVGTPRPIAGILGSDSTQILLGGWQNEGMRSGFRLQAGWWLGGDSPFGVEAGFIFINNHSNGFAANSDAFPIIARPYIDINQNNQQAVLVAFPGSSTGSIDARLTAGNFYSANFDITEKAFDVPGYRLTAMVGYRYYRFDDAVNIRQALTVTNPSFIPGTTVVNNDSFTARNEFHGFDMGFRSQHQWGNFTFEFLTKIAVGDIRRQININGDQTTTVPGAAPVVDQAGVLALSTNSGQYISHDWKVMPEFGVSVGWQVRPNINLRVGYSFIFLNGVARASDQIDQSLNPNLFPPSTGVGVIRPGFNLVRNDMWIQSINVGVLLTY